MSVLDIIKKAVSRDRASSPPAQPNDGLGFGSSGSTTAMLPSSRPIAPTPAMSMETLARKAPEPIMSVKPTPAPVKEPGLIKKIAKSVAPDSYANVKQGVQSPKITEQLKSGAKLAVNLPKELVVQPAARLVTQLGRQVVTGGNDQGYTPGNVVTKNLLGQEEVKPLDRELQDSMSTAYEYVKQHNPAVAGGASPESFSSKFISGVSTPFAALAIGGVKALDVEPGAGGKGKKVSKEVAEETAGPATKFLSKFLAGAKPRYKDIVPEFASDIDKAAYIVAKRGTPSKRDAEYLSELMSHTGWTKEQAIKHGEDVRGAVKTLANKAKEGEGVVVPVQMSRAVPASSVAPAPTEGLMSKIAKGKKKTPRQAEEVVGEMSKQVPDNTVAANVDNSLPNVSQEVDATPQTSKVDLPDDPETTKVKQLFRTDKVTTVPEEVKIIEDRRTALGLTTRDVRTHEEVKKLAYESGIDLKTLLDNSTKAGLTDDQVVQLRSLMKADTSEIARLTALKNANPDQELSIGMEIAKHEAQLDRTLRKFTAGQTETARALSAMRLTAMENMDQTYWLKRAQREAGRDLTGSEVHNILDAAGKKDPLKIVEAVNAVRRESDILDKTIGIWKAGLLSSPTTHLANMGGNVIMQMMETAKDIPAAMIDIVVSAIRGKPRTIGLNLEGSLAGLHVGDAWKGLKEGGVRKAASDWVEGMRRGIAEEEVMKFDLPQKLTFDQNSFFGRAAQKYTDTVFGALSMQDRIFAENAMKRSLFEQAKLAAKEAGKKGDDFVAEVKRLVNKPTEDMLQNAINDSEYATFHRNTTIGNMLSGLQKGANKTSVGKIAAEVILPFKKTPAAVATTILDYTPAGFITAVAKGIKGGSQREVIQSLSRALTGTAMIGSGAILAKNNLITGSYPRDPKERIIWQQQKAIPNAVKIDGHWVELSRLGPFGAILGIGADSYNALQDGGDALDVAKAGAASAITSFGDQPYVQGMSAVADTLKDPERNLMTIPKQVAGSIVPALIGRTAKVVDPIERENKTIKDAFMSRIPGVSQSMPEKLDAFGRELKDNRPWYERAVQQYFSPVRVNVIDENPVFKKMQELYDANEPIMPTAIQDTLKMGGFEIPMEKKEKMNLQRAIGGVQLDEMEKAIADPEFQTLPLEQQSKALQGMMNDAYNTVRAEMFAPQIAQNVVNLQKAIASGDTTAGKKLLAFRKSGLLKNPTVQFELQRLGQSLLAE